MILVTYNSAHSQLGYLLQKRKDEHIVKFKELLAPPPGFDLEDWPNMHAFHAVAQEGVLSAVLW